VLCALRCVKGLQPAAACSVLLFSLGCHSARVTARSLAGWLVAQLSKRRAVSPCNGRTRDAVSHGSTCAARVRRFRRSLAWLHCHLPSDCSGFRWTAGAWVGQDKHAPTQERTEGRTQQGGGAAVTAVAEGGNRHPFCAFDSARFVLRETCERSIALTLLLLWPFAWHSCPTGASKQQSAEIGYVWPLILQSLPPAASAHVAPALASRSQRIQLQQQQQQHGRPSSRARARQIQRTLCTRTLASQGRRRRLRCWRWCPTVALLFQSVQLALQLATATAAAVSTSASAATIAASATLSAATARRTGKR